MRSMHGQVLRTDDNCNIIHQFDDDACKRRCKWSMRVYCYYY